MARKETVKASAFDSSSMRSCEVNSAVNRLMPNMVDPIQYGDLMFPVTSMQCPSDLADPSCDVPNGHPPATPPGHINKCNEWWSSRNGFVHFAGGTCASWYVMAARLRMTALVNRVLRMLAAPSTSHSTENVSRSCPPLHPGKTSVWQQLIYNYE
jgi:hypothetical protein